MNINKILICLIVSFFLIQSCHKDDFPAIEYGSMSDVEGNIYKTVKIGTQVWMAENLKTTKYDNGIVIPNVRNDTIWSNLITGAYCWYDNKAENKIVYGALYNWYAAMKEASSSSANPSGVQGVCPTGWHLPSDAEWTVLSNELGGQGVAGGKLKEIGTTYWGNPNFGATNESGFSGLPGGYRHFRGYFDECGYMGHWWSSTEPIDLTAWSWHLICNGNHFPRYGSGKQEGLSVRCVQN